MREMANSPEPLGYVGQASIDLMLSGQSAGCALSKQKPSVDGVAVYTATQLEAAILAERTRCIEKINNNVPTGGWERGTEDIQFHAALMVRDIMEGEA